MDGSTVEFGVLRAALVIERGGVIGNVGKWYGIRVVHVHITLH